MSAPLAVRVDGEPATSVPVSDRGFLYGEALFEVLRTYQGRPAFLAAHLDRMARGGRCLDFAEPCPREAFEGDVRALVRDRGADVLLRLYWTAGDGAGLAAQPARTRRVAMAFALQCPPPEAYAQGVGCVVVPGRATTLGAAKLADYVANARATRQARRRGAHEALMEDPEGQVAEGASSNLFGVWSGIVRTPPLGPILPGVTRAEVLRLARDQGLFVDEAPITREALVSADELFITSSAREVLPIRSVEGRSLGAPGPVTRRLMAAYAQSARADAAIFDPS